MADDRRPPAPLSLVIPSQLVCVAPLGKQVRAACVEVGMGPDAAGEVEISVVEVVNNVIEHAYKMADDRQVLVTLEADRQRVRVEVIDDGYAMPRETLKRAAAPEFDLNDQDSIPEGGMGLYLVKQLMDAVRYEHRDGKNVLSMDRHIARGPRRPQT
jgi:serine/threonine-protein kinase RsbW